MRITSYNDVPIQIMASGDSGAFFYHKTKATEPVEGSFYEQHVSNEVFPGRFEKGILHFYPRSFQENKDEEEKNVGDSWVFSTGEIKDSNYPAISLAIKHPIDNFYTYQEYFRKILAEAS
mmetsp:Transcript_9491/g.9030  ORF Transcript_9491/g.9030 Transcript_9491/m.9030 type:complete len:120 (+) Transcript_9491:5147-5506(+)